MIAWEIEGLDGGFVTGAAGSQRALRRLTK